MRCPELYLVTGTHNGASPDIVNTSMAPPAQLHSSAAAGPQAEACLSAAAATLKANHAVKESRPSPGSSESETEGGECVVLINPCEPVCCGRLECS